MRKWIALGVTGAALAWGPYLYSELAHSSPGRAARERSKLSTTQLMAAEASPSAPAANVTTEQQLSAATTPAPGPRPAPPSLPPRAAASPVPTPQPSAAAAKPTPAPSETEASPDGDRPEETLPSEHLAQFRSAFDTEPRDAFWAVDEEPRLSGLLHEAGVPASANVETACRKTVCRLEVPLDLEDQVETKLNARLRQEFGKHLAREETTTGEQHASLYVLRRGYDLEPSQARR
jgi:hypothetical protein